MMIIKAEIPPKDFSCHEYAQYGKMHNMQIEQYVDKFVQYALYVQYSEYEEYVICMVCQRIGTICRIKKTNMQKYAYSFAKH